MADDEAVESELYRQKAEESSVWSKFATLSSAIGHSERLSEAVGDADAAGSLCLQGLHGRNYLEKDAERELEFEEDGAHNSHEEALQVVEDADERETEGRRFFRL